ncbi:DNA cytosine methyltransferase [Capnocytophaga stomatis]|uniref:DNA cytosine methyltransferase n=1 Tax=Capnocytophaga stomatis TaxID=1848904 RepID=A0ABW8Q8C2_9FLAO
MTHLQELAVLPTPLKIFLELIIKGFPDDWTKYGNYDGVVKEIAKTQRYKMLGNAVSVPVVEEIANRLKNNFKG